MPDPIKILIIDDNPVRISVLQDGLAEAGYTRVAVISDMRHLLGKIVDADPDVIFIDLDIAVHAARITTLGERVEDVFFISDPDGKQIRDPTVIARLTATICRRLDQDLLDAPRAEAAS